MQDKNVIKNKIVSAIEMNQKIVRNDGIIS